MTLTSLSPAASKYNVSPAATEASQTKTAVTPQTATGLTGLGTIHGPSSNRTQGDLAHQYLAWSVGGKGFSVGHALGALTGSVGRVFRKAGDLVQGADNQRWETSKSGFRHVTGKVLKGIGNILGAATDFAFSTVATWERRVSDLAGFALRLAGAGVLGVGAGLAYGVGRLGGDASVGRAGLEFARDLVVNSPMLTRGREKALTDDAAKTFFKDVERVNLSPMSIREAYKFKENDFPEAVKKKFVVDMKADPGTYGTDARPQVRSGSWTDVRVDPSWATDDKGKRVLYLNFHGSRSAQNWKSDFAQGLGIRDGAFRDAKEITRMFVEEYSRRDPPIEIRLVGHSMGGALAQYAGISMNNGMKVTCVNSAGLHPMTLEKLGAERINNSSITHFNNSNDWLSHRLEAKLSPLGGVQVGTCYVVPNESSIKQSHAPDNIERELSSTVMRIENEASRARQNAAKTAASPTPNPATVSSQPAVAPSVRAPAPAAKPEIALEVNPFVPPSQSP
jgi:hypothetical protein